mmetsp:Transcript_25888/g.74216  ORF Transcript_25888/g.74216 Transcript_25888/m.74216 type:complete len:215 (-) Transcript_25888:998-1642(-)
MRPTGSAWSYPTTSAAGTRTARGRTASSTWAACTAASSAATPLSLTAVTGLGFWTASRARASCRPWRWSGCARCLWWSKSSAASSQGRTARSGSTPAGRGRLGTGAERPLRNCRSPSSSAASRCSGVGSTAPRRTQPGFRQSSTGSWRHWRARGGARRRWTPLRRRGRGRLGTSRAGCACGGATRLRCATLPPSAGPTLTTRCRRTTTAHMCWQ